MKKIEVLFWKIMFDGAAKIKEEKLVKILLKKRRFAENKTNTQRMYQRIYQAEAEGYIRQTKPLSHIWEIAENEENAELRMQNEENAENAERQIKGVMA